MSLLDRVRDGLIALLAGVEHAIVAAFEAAIGDVVSAGGGVLMAAAGAAVHAAEAAGGTGAEKFKAARDAVIGTLENQGVAVVEHAVQLAILTAVSKLRADAAAGAPAPEPAVTAPAAS